MLLKQLLILFTQVVKTVPLKCFCLFLHVVQKIQPIPLVGQHPLFFLQRGILIPEAFFFLLPLRLRFVQRLEFLPGQLRFAVFYIVGELLFCLDQRIIFLPQGIMRFLK